jgi:hypothetical protein
MGGRCRELRLCVLLVLRVNLRRSSRGKRVLIGYFFYGAILEISEFWVQILRIPWKSAQPSWILSSGFGLRASRVELGWVWMSSHAWRLYMGSPQT